MLQFLHGRYETMNTYKFKLSKIAVLFCILGLLLGAGGIAFTVYRILRLGFTSPQLIIQHVILLIIAPLAIAIFASILIRSVYKVTDKEIVLWFGFIKSSYSIANIESIHLFSKTNKLVLYFKDEKYTVIVVKPEWYNDFTKDILSRNNKIRYDVSTTDKDDLDDL